MSQTNFTTTILWLRICILSFVTVIVSLVIFSLTTREKNGNKVETEQEKTGQSHVQGSTEIRYTPSFIII